LRRKSRVRKTIFVSYQYVSDSGNGFGNHTGFTKCGSITNDDLREIESMIKETNRFKAVVILYYKFI
jgi:hypothetical protein